MQEEPSLKVPALIALVCGLIGAVSTLMMADITVAMLPAEMKGLGWLLVAFSRRRCPHRRIPGLDHIWFYLSYHLHGLQGSGFTQSDSGGHGLWIPPSGLWWHNRSIFSYLLLSGLTVPAMSSAEEIAAFSENLVTVLTTDPLAQVAGIVSILFLIWSATSGSSA